MSNKLRLNYIKMALTIKSYFEHTYLISSPLILDILDVRLVRSARQHSLIQIRAGRNIMSRRKFYEMEYIWQLIKGEKYKTTFTALKELYNQFMRDVNSTDLKSCNNEIKEPELKIKNRDIIVCDKRELTSPIFISDLEYFIRIEYLPNSNRVVNDLKENTILFRKNITKNRLNLVWDMIAEYNYNNKSVIDFCYAKHIFSIIPIVYSNKVSTIINDSVFLMFMILNLSGVYNSAGSDDYKNIAMHIILRGKEYCCSILNNPSLAIDMIKKKEYHPIYNIYKIIFGTNCL